ncbi:hypothetical protein [Xanthomonas graminis]|uniref:hypothetical protein n=1 Tax=Xanthomonas graminis TaxID=3390026 RepID=UPI001F2ABBC9|nr:hypothetical protein [Xanthomonas translucens]UKE71956.1 hypothetical protein KFS85_12790 [Xanthomonas translucens pv. phleipratensis]
MESENEKISLSAVIVAMLISGVGCSVSEKAVYGNLQALDLQYAENKGDLLVAKIGGARAVRFRVGDERVWWVLNQLSKEKEIYSFPGNNLILECQAVDRLKERVRLDWGFEKKAYSIFKK